MIFMRTLNFIPLTKPGLTQLCKRLPPTKIPSTVYLLSLPVDGQNPATTKDDIIKLSHFLLRVFHHPNGGCLGFLNHQQLVSHPPKKKTSTSNTAAERVAPSPYCGCMAKPPIFTRDAAQPRKSNSMRSCRNGW